MAFFNGGDDTTLDFLDTTRYPGAGQAMSIQLPVPPPWTRHMHPNGDIYYYNSVLRLLTPENICDPTTLQYVSEASEEHTRSMDAESKAQLPDDLEMTVTDVTDEAAVICMYSRKQWATYDWTEERGLQIKSAEQFWSHVAEYPSHHEDLPPDAEATFLNSLETAKRSIERGYVLPYTTIEIDQIMQRYESYKVRQAQGQNVIPLLGWLIGAVLPLEPRGEVNEEELSGLLATMEC